MRNAAIISGLGHVAVIAMLSLGLPSADRFESAPIETVPVEFVDISELTKLRAGDRKAEPKETQEAATEAPPEDPHETPPPQRQEQAAAPPPAPEPPAPEPLTPEPPTPVPAPKPAAVPAPAPTPRREAKSEPEPAPRDKDEAEQRVAIKNPPMPALRPPPPRRTPPAPKRENFNPDNIAALLNKIPDQPQPRQATELAAQTPAFGVATGTNTPAMTMSEVDAIRAQISRCWSPPIGVQGAETLAVRLKLALNPDGSLSQPPEVVNAAGGLAFQVAAESAMRAVRRCQPYNLPAEKYETWRSMLVRFDPREMAGG